MKLKIIAPAGMYPQVEILKPKFVPRIGEHVFFGHYPHFVVSRVTYNLIEKEIVVYTRTE